MYSLLGTISPVYFGRECSAEPVTGDLTWLAGAHEKQSPMRAQKRQSRAYLTRTADMYDMIEGGITFTFYSLKARELAHIGE